MTTLAVGQKLRLSRGKRGVIIIRLAEDRYAVIFSQLDRQPLVRTTQAEAEQLANRFLERD